MDDLQKWWGAADEQMILAWITALGVLGGLVVAVLTYRIVRKSSSSVKWETSQLETSRGVRFALTNTGGRRARNVSFAFEPDQPARLITAAPAHIDGGAFHDVHFLSSYTENVSTFVVSWREGLWPRTRHWRTSIPSPPPKLTRIFA